MNTPLLRWLIIGIIGGSIATACQPTTGPSTAPPPAPTSTPLVLVTPLTTTRAFHTAHPAATVIPIAPTDEAASCEETPTDEQATIRYQITADLDYAVHSVHATQSVEFQNSTGEALSELVFYIAANKEPGIFRLEAVMHNEQDEAPAAVLEGVRLSVPLADVLLPGCHQTLELSYTVFPPRIGTGFFPRQGYLGHSDRQFNLGQWTPVIAAYQDGGWLTPAPINVGEQTVTPAADYELALTISNAPANLTVVGPGRVRRSDGTWHFSLAASRDFVLSLSSEYYQYTTTSANGVQVELYVFDDALPPADADYDAPAHALDTATTALELYADLYGPYPYERLVILESDFPDGMEFSGLVFVGGEWFRSYHGSPAGYLTLITAHEVSHQWWYNIVANDQSASPWLDEALATYSEYVYLEENYPNLTDWWWGFRVNAYEPEGTVDSSVYRFESIRAYINAVYLQGARLMHALRQEMGGEVFFQWLQDYVAATRGQIATPADLWAALPAPVFARTEDIRATYFSLPVPRP
jgi:hypothetical protein